MSLWELTTKRSIGKLRFHDGFFTQLTESGYTVLSLAMQDIIAYGKLPLYHRDPFDRMLIAQAQSQGLTVLTMDKEMKKYSDIITLL